MRILKFIVDSRGLRKDPTCDFSGLMRSATSVTAEFTFSPEWDNTNVRVAGFWSNGEELSPQVLINNACIIPREVLTKPVFEMQVLGKKNTATMKTNKLQVRLNGGGL